MKYCFRYLSVFAASFCLTFLASIALATVDTSFTSMVKTAAIPFIANQGQLDDSVSFYARTLGGTLFVTRNGELVYNLPKIDVLDLEDNNKKKNIGYSGGVVLKENLVNARVGKISTLRQAPTKVNYFKGNYSSKWQTGIPTFEEISLGEVYEGIEVRLKAYGINVEKLFYVKPGADPDQIIVRLSGADGIRVLDTGELQVSTSLGTVNFTRPVAWQKINGKRIPISVVYNTFSNNRELGYSFTIGSYDKSSSLVIDPLLASTYLGGDDYEYVKSMVLDSTGQVYVTGCSLSLNYPTTAGAYGESHNGGGRDIIISKFSSDFSSLLASIYLGGADNECGHSIIFDSSDNLLVTGYSASTDYPTTAGAYQTQLSSSYDIILTRFSSDLTTLITSTYLGGKDQDIANSITLDSSGNVYLTGYSLPIGSGTDRYPTTAGAYRETYIGLEDIIISKLSSDLSTLLASTYIGGTSCDYGQSIALDAGGNLYVAGYIRPHYSPTPVNYPSTPGAYDQTQNGLEEIIISKFSNDLTTLIASTFIGGSSDDRGYSMVLDSAGDVYVTGNSSGNFPTTSAAYDQTANGLEDVIVAKLSSDLGTLKSSTFLGGDDEDTGHSIALDSEGNVYVTGYSRSSDYPTTNRAYSENLAGSGYYADIIVSKLSSNLSSLNASTYLGGGSSDEGFFIAFDSTDNLYIAGTSFSVDYPTTTGAYDQSHNGDADVVVAKFSSDLLAAYTVSARAGTHGRLDASTPSPQEVTYGLTTSFIFHADENYYVARILGCGINYTNKDEAVTSKTVTTGIITGNCSVYARFTPFYWPMFMPAITKSGIK